MISALIGPAVFAAFFSIALAAQAQEGAQAQDDLEAPAAWDLVKSVGQPARYNRFATFGVGVDRLASPSATGVQGSAGAQRSIGSPIMGVLAIGGEGYLGHREKLHGGLKAYLTSPALYLHTGVDWNVRLHRADFLLGLTAPLRRGGWPLPGSELRAEWIPGRRHSTNVAMRFPLGQPLAGRTRPRRIVVVLPDAGGRTAALLLPPGTELQTAMRDARSQMTQLVLMLTFFWLIEDRHMRHEANVRDWRETLADFAAEFFPETGTVPQGREYPRIAESYHSQLDRAFGLAAGGDGDSDVAVRGRVLADAARRMALEEVILPYNRMIGQYRKPNSVNGLLARASARYAAWLSLHSDIQPERVPDVLAVADTWLSNIEELRGRIDGITDDPRMTWLPLGLVLRPEQHRTQEQVDEIVALAMGGGFERGNTVRTIDGPQFQRELKRTIRETQSYHALWIHDYRGRDDLGDPDRTGFETTLTYLRALRDAVNAYDRTGRFPTYMILNDQYFYELRDGRLWLTLLEQPLRHQIRLGPRFAEMEAAIASLQDSLRAAVRSSVRLQAQAAASAPRSVEGLVKVHVSVTNPSDWTFRSLRIHSLPFSGDNMLRDHRKLILRDADESDPAAGELIVTGVGVGDHYSSATWDDRAMIVIGPGVAATRKHLRATFERHRLGGESMPAALRPRAPPPDYANRVAALESSGATARFIQAHNEIGWGRKDASFIQMLLYDLAPAGTLIFVPDGMWLSYQWMAQLVGAALRGCHVYVVAPAFGNEPSSVAPLMSVQQELVTRVALVQEVLGTPIRAGGGDLRLGFFAREERLDDHAASLDYVERAWARYPFLGTLIPFTAEARAAFADAAERMRDAPPAAALVADVSERKPLLHRKVQWVLGGEALRAIAAAPELPEVLQRILLTPAETLATASPIRPPQGDPGVAGTSELPRLYSQIADPSADPVLYHTSGSINKSVRAMILDGEMLGVVAGPWALESFVDFVLLTASITWAESVEDVERLLPPYKGLWRRFGRWWRSVL